MVPGGMHFHLAIATLFEETSSGGARQMACHARQDCREVVDSSEHAATPTPRWSEPLPVNILLQPKRILQLSRCAGDTEAPCALVLDLAIAPAARVSGAMYGLMRRPFVPPSAATSHLEPVARSDAPYRGTRAARPLQVRRRR